MIHHNKITVTWKSQVLTELISAEPFPDPRWPGGKDTTQLCSEIDTLIICYNIVI